MADLLTADEVGAALASLPEWSGDTSRLVRRASVPQSRQDELVDTIMRAADEMNHHPNVERDGDTVTFLIWSHDVGGVTTRDVELAARIDEVLSDRDAAAG